MGSTGRRKRSWAYFGVLLGAVLALGACSEEWTATVYPDREKLETFDRVGVFGDLEQCRAAATDALANIVPQAVDVFPGWECGRNCRLDDEGDLRCDKYEQG